jgi:CTP:molybdopterin cytidylyltransferase MocA/SAM-dependent methyltransferase
MIATSRPESPVPVIRARVREAFVPNVVLTGPSIGQLVYLPEMHQDVTAIVLAAGAGSRFGGAKLLALLDGRPILQHVLDTLAAADVGDVVVVLGQDLDAVERAISWHGERRVENPDPSRGLASSAQRGMEALAPGSPAALIVLGDQPLVSVETILALLAAPADPSRPVVVPRYADDRGRNPVLLRRAAFDLVADATGDRGLGPILEAHPELVEEVPVSGSNPDVDTRDDLARLVESDWASRVRANRDQVDRVREVPDGKDFYAPVRSMFRADPTRTDDPVLAALLTLVRPGDAWLDVGAGAGRFALPIAMAVAPSGGSVIALDASASMLEAAREIAAEFGIVNLRTIEARWPPTDVADESQMRADVVLIAHVGYDVEAIGPFLDAMEAAASRELIAVLMDQMPASAADAFWPPVHGETRVGLPALAAFGELLRARGRHPTIERVTAERRRLESREAVEAFARQQLWIDPSGPKEARFQAALSELAVRDGDGWTIAGRGPLDIGIVRWSAS